MWVEGFKPAHKIESRGVTFSYWENWNHISPRTLIDTKCKANIFVNTEDEMNIVKLYCFFSSNEVFNIIYDWNSTGYADLMVIPKGATSVLITDNTWNYLGKSITLNNDFIICRNHWLNNCDWLILTNSMSLTPKDWLTLWLMSLIWRGANAPNVSFETLYGGQFTLLIQ